MSRASSRSSRHGRWAAARHTTLCITWVTKRGWPISEERSRQFWSSSPPIALLAGVPHVELKAIGSPYEVIEREAQACDLVLLARGSDFRFLSKDDEDDETLKKVSKCATRPLVVVSGTCPDGPVVIASDGSAPSHSRPDRLRGDRSG